MNNVFNYGSLYCAPRRIFDEMYLFPIADQLSILIMHKCYLDFFAQSGLVVNYILKTGTRSTPSPPPSYWQPGRNHTVRSTTNGSTWQILESRWNISEHHARAIHLRGWRHWGRFRWSKGLHQPHSGEKARVSFKRDLRDPSIVLWKMTKYSVSTRTLVNLNV